MMEDRNGNNLIGRVGDFFRKLYRFRLKVNRKGKPIVNISSLFAAACLIFAPHMTLAGIVVSLILGYQIHFENEPEDAELAPQVRSAVQNMKESAVNAAKTIQTEINKAREERKTAAEQDSSSGKGEMRTQEPAVSSEDLMRDLEAHAAEAPVSNPAATTFHSAYAASAGTVPVLQVHGNEQAENLEPGAPKAKAGE